jgi:serine protease AprX
MANSRVIAFLVGRNDRLKVEGVLADAVFTDAFAIGNASLLTIRRLREQQNLVVQELDSGDTRTGRREAETPGSIALGPGRGVLRLPLRPISTDDAVPDVASTILVETMRPLLESDREALSNAGGELLASYANGHYSVRLERSSVAAVRALPFVGRIRSYGVSDSIATNVDDLVGDAVDVAAGGYPPSAVPWDVRVHEKKDLAKLLMWLGKASVPILGRSDRKARISAPRGDAVLLRIAGLDIVQRIERYVEPELWNDVAASILRVHAPDFPTSAFDGADEIIALADTGIDEAHPDLVGRIHTLVALGRADDASDPNGHGTHVAGSVVGTGADSNGEIKGIAPAAKLYFQSLLDANGKLGGLPIDLAELLQPAYDAGARIHSNSWGAVGASTYTVGADEVDAFVRTHPDLLVITAAGNDGRAMDNLNAAAGYTDWLSIGSPATAKNALTVGASRSSRTDGPSRTRTWGQYSQTKFPDAPIVDELIVGNADCLAAFSSRGPSNDRRIKPDLVAPGTDILSTRSSAAKDLAFLGLDPQGRGYAFMQGTSMAAPLAAGCAALVRHYYRTVRQHTPSAALVRATLINGTKWMSGVDANASNPPRRTPAGNFDQGFGRLDLAMSVPGSVEALSLEFVDDQAGSLSISGYSRRFIVSVTGATWLRVCMAYTDIPGRALQNNLNLFLQDPTGGRVQLGNAQLHHGMGLPDVDNNVEVIRPKATPDGDYLIQVAATNLLRGPQGFALVVTTNGQMELTEP